MRKILKDKKMLRVKNSCKFKLILGLFKGREPILLTQGLEFCFSVFNWLKIFFF